MSVTALLQFDNVCLTRPPLSLRLLVNQPIREKLSTVQAAKSQADVFLKGVLLAAVGYMDGDTACSMLGTEVVQY